jgi:7-cyano-7-deazaguanine synthase
MNKVIVSFSGGMDSATLLAFAMERAPNVVVTGFTYGSKHNSYEVAAAREVCRFYDLQYFNLDLTPIMGTFKSNLLKGGGPIPEGHYEAESMRQTVVPARNIIFASILAGQAWSLDADTVMIGVHAGDHYIYPDCREEFINVMAKAIWEGTDGRVRLQAPFIAHKKDEILEWGLRHKVPYHLTRTCYKDQAMACGKCGSCQERLVAFAENNLNDPLPYDSREILPKEPK